MDKEIENFIKKLLKEKEFVILKKIVERRGNLNKDKMEENVQD